MSGTTGQKFTLNSGDLVLATPAQRMYTELHRTPNEIEAQRLLRQLESEGRTVVVFRVVGVVNGK